MERAQEVNRRLARHVDVMIGNEEDFTACLGFAGAKGVDGSLTELDTAKFRTMIEHAIAEFPNFAVVATTLRSRAQRDASTTGGRSPGHATDGFLEATPRPGWRSSTASAAATASPPG